MNGTLSRLKSRADAWFAAARANPLFRAGMIGAACVAILDQAAKFWIVEILRLQARAGGRIELSPIFDLTYVQNKGASFGMLAGGAGSRILLSLISIGVSTALTLWLARISRPIQAAGVALIIGGAVGNLVDRLLLGYVVDFLDFSGLHFEWVFNVADAAINVGIAFFLLDAWLDRKRGGPKQDPGPP